MSGPAPQAGLAGRQYLTEIDPNRVLAHQPSNIAKSTAPIVSAVPCPLPKFVPGPLPAALPAHPSAARPPAPQSFISAAAAHVPKAAPPRKRNSDALEDESSSAGAQWGESGNPDGDLSNGADDCDVVRRKIHAFIGSGAMKVGEFQRAIGVSANVYGAFMKQDGPSAGQRSATYKNASAFFRNRGLNGPSDGSPTNSIGPNNAAKRTKKNDGAVQGLDVSGVTLPGEEQGRVPVFDTCNEVRRKIRAFLKKDGLSQAAFCRELTKMVANQGRRVNASSLANFMSQKGPSGGSGSVVFYAAYVYFEKMRVRDGKPKSQMRQEMESVWGRDGMTLPEEGRGGRRHYLCLANEQPYEDKYGMIHIARR